MAQRITDKQLQSVVDRINKITGMPPAPYDEHSNPCAGNFHLDYAYGMQTLSRMAKVGTGSDNVLGVGFVSKYELYHLMHAFIRGLNFKEQA